jgi:hypothetical protein
MNLRHLADAEITDDQFVEKKLVHLIECLFHNVSSC